MSPSAAPPSPQEIHRKLSVHSVAKGSKLLNVSVAPVSGTESDSDSILTPDISSPLGHTQAGHGSGSHGGTSSQPPLSSIAERRSGSGEDSEDDDDEEEGGWKTADVKGRLQSSVDESVIKAGYLWKKGERRKTWKKRWFVLRTAHLAYYKTSAEYQLLRLLELSDVHSCTQVALKRHENSFGLISPVRTFYLQAKTPGEVHEWVKAIEETRQTLMATSTQISASSPIAIPNAKTTSATLPPHPVTPSPPSHLSHYQNITSSDSEDASPSDRPKYPIPSQHLPNTASSPTKSQAIDPAKTILSGYLMKCGSKRRNWRKRWFVLTGEKLVYSGSHMDTKPHRQFPFAAILDALEYDLPLNRQNVVHTSPPASSPPAISSPSGDATDETQTAHTFKIVTTKRTLLLCAPSEEDEIKWLGAVRALIARRTGAGVVPRVSGVGAKMSADPYPNAKGSTPGVSASAKGRAGQSSTSGSSGFTGIVIAEEGAQDKQA